MPRVEITKKVKKLLLYGGVNNINAILSRKLDENDP
jgi:hypothetical protein